MCLKRRQLKNINLNPLPLKISRKIVNVAKRFEKYCLIVVLVFHFPSQIFFLSLLWRQSSYNLRKETYFRSPSLVHRFRRIQTWPSSAAG